MCSTLPLWGTRVSIHFSTLETTNHELRVPVTGKASKPQLPHCHLPHTTRLSLRNVPRTPTFCYGYNAPVPSTKKSLTTFCPKTTCNQPSNTSIPSHQPRPLSTPLHLFPTHSTVPTHWPLTGRHISPTRRLLN